MAWDPIDEAELNPGYPVLKHMRKAWNSLLWLYGQLGTAVADGIQNASFEVDSDGGGVPDGWDWSTYPGGAIAIDTTTPAHGTQAVKITHPGGAGNGGGTLTSDYVVCDQLVQQFVGFIHWASAAGMKNRVQVKYYDKSKVLLSTETLYESTANPSSARYYMCGFTPPSNSRYFKLVLSGGVNDTNVAGTAYFDGVRAVGIEVFKGQTLSIPAIAENATSSMSWTDSGTASFDLPVSGLPVTMMFSAEVHGNTVNGFQRFRVGSAYSNEVEEASAGYITHNYTISFTPTLSGSQVLTMQLKAAGAYPIYGRKASTSAALRFDYANL